MPNPLARLVLALALVVGLSPAAPLAAQAPPPDPDTAMLNAANQSRMKGAEGAPITIIELADFQCPFCRQFAQETLAALDSAFIATGKARMVYVNLPLPNHLGAWAAAEAALCAGAQQRFWPMHDRLYADQSAWSGSPDATARFEGYAAEIGVDLTRFRDCTGNDRVAALLVDDLLQAVNGGASATPTFVILRAAREGESAERSQRILQGYQPFSEFEKAIAELTR